MPKEIGKRVKDMREAMDLSQLELASMANIPQSTLSNIENAEQAPAIDKVAKLADALGVSTADLLGERTCPICGFEYTYDEGLSSRAHRIRHDRVQEVIGKYGFYWPYRQRQAEIAHAETVMQDPQAKDTEKVKAAIYRYKALFSRSVISYEYDDHPDFETYVQMMLEQESGTPSRIPKAVMDKLVKKYGKRPGMEGGSYYQRSHVTQDGIVENGADRISALAEKKRKLPQRDLDIIEYICNRAEEKGGKKT